MWVATTRLALALAAGGAGQAKRDGNEGFIVVETNYRVSLLQEVLAAALCCLHGIERDTIKSLTYKLICTAYRCLKERPLQHLEACTITVWQSRIRGLECNRPDVNDVAVCTHPAAVLQGSNLPGRSQPGC